MRHDFPKSRRLSLSSEFLLVKKKGESFKGRFLVLGVLPESGAGDWRLGIVTTRKIGGAVARNRVRRRFRELARLELPRGEKGVWLVAVARRAAVDAPWDELRKEWRRLMRRAGLATRAGSGERMGPLNGENSGGSEGGVA